MDELMKPEAVHLLAAILPQGSSNMHKDAMGIQKPTSWVAKIMTSLQVHSWVLK